MTNVKCERLFCEHYKKGRCRKKDITLSRVNLEKRVLLTCENYVLSKEAEETEKLFNERFKGLD